MMLKLVEFGLWWVMGCERLIAHLLRKNYRLRNHCLHAVVQVCHWVEDLWVRRVDPARLGYGWTWRHAWWGFWRDLACWVCFYAVLMSDTITAEQRASVWYTYTFRHTF